MKSAETMKPAEAIEPAKAKAEEHAALSHAGEEKPDSFAKKSFFTIFGFVSVMVFAVKAAYKGLEKLAAGGGKGGGGGGGDHGGSHGGGHH